MWTNFQKTKANQDSYGKNCYSEYLSFLLDPRVYGTEDDIVMLCKFLNISIDVYSLSSVQLENGELTCSLPFKFGNETLPNIKLWHYKEHD
jgi:hypothetical protein